jgi:thiol-disulfide isomerase/thioredoxin
MSHAELWPQPLTTPTPTSSPAPLARHGRWQLAFRGALAASALTMAGISGCDSKPDPTDGAAATGTPADLAPAAVPSIDGNPEPTTPTPPAGTAPASGDANDAPGLLELPGDFDPTKLPPATPAPSKAGDPIQNGTGLELPATGDSSFVLPPARELTLTATPLPIAPPDPASKPAATAAQAIPLTAATWEQIVAAVAKTGRVTVVDLWSLACEPCLKEFPGLVKIHNEMGKQVACVSVNLDFDGRRTKPAESYRPRAEAFLSSVKATFPNYLSLTPSDEAFSAAGIDSIPAVMIFDASGKLVRTFSDVGEDAGFTYEKNIIPFVSNLVSPKP